MRGKKAKRLRREYFTAMKNEIISDRYTKLGSGQILNNWLGIWRQFKKVAL